MYYAIRSRNNGVPIMTPDQQKELDALNEALKSLECGTIEHESFGKFGAIVCDDMSDANALRKAAQSYADHFAEIQTLKSGEWVLVPVEPTDGMLLKAQKCGSWTLDAKDTNTLTYKNMIAARPKLEE